MKPQSTIAVIVLMAVLLASGSAAAMLPDAVLGYSFTYQGWLTDGGSPANGFYDFEFRLTDALSGGSQVGSTVIRDDVTVTNGLFTVGLDFGNVFDGTELYLDISVRPGASVGAYTGLSPRQAITPTPYAVYSLKTAEHDHWGNVWSGTTGYTGLRVSHTASSGYNTGVQGVSASNNGLGVYGLATAITGITRGVAGEANSTNGTGVFGVATSTTGSNYGVWGQSFSAAGIGLYGQAIASTGTNFGVYGSSYSDQGYGVYGANLSTTGVTYGVLGSAASPDGYAGYFTGEGNDAVVVVNTSNGRGIYVDTSVDTAIWAVTDAGIAGVDGRNASSTGRGLYGYATAATGTNYGVYGRTNSSAGYAGYFQGNLHTTATLSKAAGSFMIDHPLDPANQYLYHSFVESPDMMNIYNGNVVLDENGQAWVDLPDWFEALNRDFRYQLTPIGGPGPNLYIAQEIQNNRFLIAGGTAGLRVSWEVTGIRQDAYANAHRIPVEEPKPVNERGLFLHPVELGQPAELGLDYQLNLDETEPPDVDQYSTPVTNP